MSKFTPITLTGTVSSFSGSLLYGESDGSGLQTQYKTFDVVIESISTQQHADAATREPLLYNGLDLEAGMFISDDGGNTIVKITSISQKSETTLICVCEDVDMVSFRLNNSNTMANGNTCVLFDLNPEGEPIIVGSPFLSGALDKVQSRFNLNERDDRVKFSHSSAPSVDVGDIVTVNTSGDLVKFGAAGGSNIKVGVVLEKLRNGKDVFLKPFNDIIREYGDPESLTGNPAGIYYTDQSNAGEITTTAGGKATFLQLNTAIATTQAITSATQPGASDTITFNGVTVFDGPGGDSVADANAFSTLINTFTAQSHVSSAITQAPGSVDAESNNLSYSGIWGEHDIFIPLNTTGAAAPANFPEISISDGNTTANVVFNTSDATAIGYDVISPAGIAAEIQAVVTANNLDITVEVYSSTAHNGEAVRLTTTGSATGITLANITADPFGGNVVGNGSSTGIGTSATLGAATLTLTRASGGPIEIDGTPLSGSYLNQGGVVSSFSGRIPFLMLIESEGGGSNIAETGVSVRTDYNQTASVTSNDGDTTGATITYTPFSDSAVIVKINRLQTNLGDGEKDQACYFSADGGVTAKSSIDIAAGDTLYWMGSLAGYELDATDEIDLVYQGSSYDV